MGVILVQFQSGREWRPDLPSLLVGIVLGVLLIWAFNRLRPALRDYGDRAIGRVQATRAWVRSGVEHRFRVETAAYVQKHHLGHARAHLEQVFVPPRLLAPPGEVDATTLPDAGPAQLLTLWPDLATRSAAPPAPAMAVRQLLLNGRRVLLCGEPGAGKSTLLAYCAYLCANASDSGPFTFLLPIMPILAHLAELDIEAPEAVADPIYPLTRALQERSGPLTGPGVATLLQQKVFAGQALLLLDGWDELPAGQEAAAQAWLRRLLAAHGGLRIVLAAPTQGFGPLVELGFTQTALLPWRVSEARTLAALWAEAAGQHKPPPTRLFWQPSQTALETTLRLWMGLDASQPRADTQTRRQTDLLETALRLLLPHDQADPPWLAPAARDLWQQVAFELLTQAKMSLGPEELSALVASNLADYETTDRSGEGLLRQTLAQSGLFALWPTGRISCTSPVWRDFLAATRLAQMQAEPLVATHLADDQWQGAVRFYVGRAGAGSLAAPLFKSAEGDLMRDALVRLASWLPEAADKGEWRRQTLIRLGKICVQPGDPMAIRQRATLALALSGEQGTLALLRELLRRPDPVLRRTAIAGIACCGAEVALPILVEMMEDQESSVREAAVQALGWLDDPATEQPILMALLDLDDRVSRAAAEALALNGGDSARVLAEALAEDDLRLRRTAIHGLALLDQLWAVSLLERIEREDDQWIVKSAAAAALDEVAARNRPAEWKLLQPGETAWLIAWAARQKRALPGGAAALPVLIEALREGVEPVTRAAAAVTLGQVMAREAMPALREAFHDPEAAVREVAFLTWARLSRAYGSPAGKAGNGPAVSTTTAAPPVLARQSSA